MDFSKMMDMFNSLTEDDIAAIASMLGGMQSDKLLGMMSSVMPKNQTINHDNGNPCVSWELTDDKGNGVYKYYYENGLPMMTCIIEGEQPSDQWFEFYDDGSINLSCNFKEGKLHGQAIKYYSGGRLAKIYNWKDGKADGLLCDYYDLDTESGRPSEAWPVSQVKEQCDWVDGVRHGQLVEYYQNGALMRTCTYDLGKVQEGKLFDPAGSNFATYTSIGAEMQFEDRRTIVIIDEDPRMEIHYMNLGDKEESQELGESRIQVVKLQAPVSIEAILAAALTDRIKGK